MAGSPQRFAQRPAAHRREEQGRLFWVWLLTLPILLLVAASLAFGAPWPSPLTQRVAMLMLAFPVLFVVGEPLLVEAFGPEGRRHRASRLVALIAVACYVSGILALFTPAPPLAGGSAVVVSAYLTVRYLANWY